VPDSKSCEALADRLQQVRPSYYAKNLAANQAGLTPQKAFAKTFTNWQFNDSILSDPSGKAYSRPLSKAEKRELASSRARSKAPALASTASHKRGEKSLD
jgi:hypothetical protein